MPIASRPKNFLGRTRLYATIRRRFDQRAVGRSHATSTFSQFGEDREVLRRLGPSRLYIDVGANHPRHNSNTYLLYLNGWRGVTLDPIRSSCVLHRALRPRDVCVNAAVGAAPGRAEFFELRPNGLSTFDSSAASALVRSGAATEAGRSTVEVLTVYDVWRTNFGDERPGLLSVDCEGMELDVLVGSQISNLRPELVLLEFQSPTGGTRREQLIDAMAEHDYRLVDEYGVNGLFAALVDGPATRAFATSLNPR